MREKWEKQFEKKQIEKNQIAKKNTQISWLNSAKLIAILAVLVDHTNGILYENQDIAYSSFFSVSLFILISGMTSYLSETGSKKSFGGGYFHKCKKIAAAYSIAVAVYMVVGTGEFHFDEYLYFLMHFNISGPHYFVLLYLQLMLCSRFLYAALRRCPRSLKGYCYEALLMAGILLFAAWTTNHTDILGVYGGGGKLFGGSFLILYFFGMLIMRHGWLKRVNPAKSAAFVLVFGISWFLLWRFTCKNGFVLESFLPYGAGFNPPGITLCLSGCCMLFLTYGFFTLLDHNRYLSKISVFTGWAGKHTMYIFLYHRLFLDFYLQKYFAALPSKQIWMARAGYFLIMLAGSMIIEFILKKIVFFINFLTTD